MCLPVSKGKRIAKKKFNSVCIMASFMLCQHQNGLMVLLT